MAAPTAPFIIHTDLSRYRDDQLCPACNGKLSSRRRLDKADTTYYSNYKEASLQRFGDKSLPLCWHCYCSNTEKCHGCELPIMIAFGSELGNILMRSTTMVVEADKRDHVCTVCHAEGKVPE